jgi:hypothetical protein
MWWCRVRALALLDLPRCVQRARQRQARHHCCDRSLPFPVVQGTVRFRLRGGVALPVIQAPPVKLSLPGVDLSASGQMALPDMNDGASVLLSVSASSDEEATTPVEIDASWSAILDLASRFFYRKRWSSLRELVLRRRGLIFVSDAYGKTSMPYCFVSRTRWLMTYFWRSVHSTDRNSLSV